jgi:hypothetical protein
MSHHGKLNIWNEIQCHYDQQLYSATCFRYGGYTSSNEMHGSVFFAVISILGVINRSVFILSDVLETELCRRPLQEILLSWAQSIELVPISET